MRLPKWTAIYNDGTQLAETDASNFYDIDRSRLERFALACSSSVEMELDASNGVFKVNGKVINHPYLDTVTFCGHVQYGAGLVQFKRGHMDINNNAAGENVVDNVNIGYKIALNGCVHQVILTYDYHTEKVYLQARVTDLIKQVVVQEIAEEVGG